jgi:hypothetical protein
MFLVYSLYGDNVPNWVVIVRKILTLYPAYNYAKCYGDIG